MRAAQPQAGGNGQRSSAAAERAPTFDLHRERRLGRLAGLAGLLSIAALFAAVVVQARATPPRERVPLGSDAPRRGDVGEHLRDFAAARDLHTLALGLRCVSLLLVIAVALFMYDAIRRREPQTSSWLGVLGVAGPVLLALSALAGFLALSGVADAFTRSGPQTAERARELYAGSAALRMSTVFEIFSRVVFGAWLCWASYLAAMRIGLLTLFVGVLGIGAGVANAIPTLASAAFAFVLFWVTSVALLALGYWPGGRPPAWDSGRPMPWVPERPER